MQKIIESIINAYNSYEEYLSDKPILQQILFYTAKRVTIFMYNKAKDIYENKAVTQWIICKRRKKCRKHKKH